MGEGLEKSIRAWDSSAGSNVMSNQKASNLAAWGAGGAGGGAGGAGGGGGGGGSGGGRRRSTAAGRPRTSVGSGRRTERAPGRGRRDTACRAQQRRGGGGVRLPRRVRAPHAHPFPGRPRAACADPRRTVHSRWAVTRSREGVRGSLGAGEGRRCGARKVVRVGTRPLLLHAPACMQEARMHTGLALMGGSERPGPWHWSSRGSPPPSLRPSAPDSARAMGGP
eukprot:52912-Chlamydomonas_euryale.AAC.3